MGGWSSKTRQSTAGTAVGDGWASRGKLRESDVFVAGCKLRWDCSVHLLHVLRPHESMHDWAFLVSLLAAALVSQKSIIYGR